MGSCHHSQRRNRPAGILPLRCRARAIDALTWSSSPAVRLVGKGNKTRSCPIWKRTADMLKPLVAGRNTEEFVFLNRRDESLTRFGIYSLVRRDDDQASRTLPHRGKAH